MIFAAALSSCDNGTAEPENPDEGDTPIIGTTVLLPNSTDSTVTFYIEFASDWEITSSSEWINITPTSGTAGITELMITALETNSSPKERIGTFETKSFNGRETHYVIQDVNPGFTIDDTYYVNGMATEFDLVFEASVGDVTITTDADWIEPGNLALDSSKVENSEYTSKYMRYTYTLTLEQNPGEKREAVLTLTGENGEPVDVRLIQFATKNADFTQTFLRRSHIYKFTGTWCGNCPNMSGVIHDVMDENPDRFVLMNVYNGSDDVGLTFEEEFSFRLEYGLDTWPSSVVNGYALVSNYNDNTEGMKDTYNGIMEEAIEKLPSNTALAGDAIINNDMVHVSVYIAAKESKPYKLSVFLLEDNIFGYQSGGGSNYEHDNITRAYFTENLLGDRIGTQDESIQVFDFEIPVPENIVNTDNLHIVAFTSYDGTFTGSDFPCVQYPGYSTCVDNVVDIPVDGSADFAYED